MMRFFGFLSSWDARFDENIIGIKMHASLQKIRPKDVDYVLERIDRHRRFLLFHVSGEFLKGRMPGRYLKDLAESFNSHPRATVIVPHFQGISRFIKCENVLFDTSFVPSGRIKKFVEGHGADRVVFGSDFPFRNPAEEMERIKGIGLGPKAEKRIFYQNIGERLKRCLGRGIF